VSFDKKEPGVKGSCGTTLTSKTFHLSSRWNPSLNKKNVAQRGADDQGGSREKGRSIRKRGTPTLNIKKHNSGGRCSREESGMEKVWQPPQTEMPYLRIKKWQKFDSARIRPRGGRTGRRSVAGGAGILLKGFRRARGGVTLLENENKKLLCTEGRARKKKKRSLRKAFRARDPRVGGTFPRDGGGTGERGRGPYRGSEHTHHRHCMETSIS